MRGLLSVFGYGSYSPKQRRVFWWPDISLNNVTPPLVYDDKLKGMSIFATVRSLIHHWFAYSHESDRSHFSQLGEPSPPTRHLDILLAEATEECVVRGPPKCVEMNIDLLSFPVLEECQDPKLIPWVFFCRPSVEIYRILGSFFARSRQIMIATCITVVELGWASDTSGASGPS